MRYPAIRSAVLLSALLFSIATLATAQQSQPTIKKVPMERTAANSGEEMFNTYCAVCHGKDAKGDGPAAAALKVPPADLTTLAARHNGKFPSDYVANVLRSGVSEAKAHGSKEMPIWGTLFGTTSEGSNAGNVALRIHNLTLYVESLQAK